MHRLKAIRLSVVGLVALAAVLCLPILVLALYPPITWDATMYHLAYAKIYLQNDAVVFTPFLRFPVFPQTNDMLFTLAMLVQDDVLAQCVELSITAALAAGMIAFGARFMTRRAGIWAVAVFLGSPLVIRLGTVAYVDMGLALFTTMATYAALVWLQKRDAGWLVVSSILCGFGVATKYTALFSVTLIIVVVAVASLQRRQVLPPVILALVALVVASPWLLRNLYYTRNPLFPFFYTTIGNILGYGVWTPEQFEGLLDDYSRFGRGKGIAALLMLPWNIVVHWRDFGGWLTSPLCLVIPQIAFIAGINRLKIAAPLAFGTAYLLFWFFTSQETHYLLPALPLLSLAAGGALDGLLLRYNRAARRVPRSFVTILGIGVLVVPGWFWTIRRVQEYGDLPTNTQTRQAFLTRWLPSYPAYDFLNRRAGRHYAVYALDQENMAYFADGVFMGDHFGLARYSRVSGSLADAEALRRELDHLGASHLLVKTNVLGPDLRATDAFQMRFRLIYDDFGVQVFELTPHPQP